MNHETKKSVVLVWIAMVATLVAAGSLAAHHSLANFDTATAVHVKGTLVRFERINPHSILFIDQKLPDGRTEHWAVDGPSVVQLDRMSISKESLKAGDVIEACGYVLKEGFPSQRTIAAEPAGENPKDSAAKSFSGRVMNGEAVVLPGGEKQAWSDYGHHHCFDADFHDSHR